MNDYILLMLQDASDRTAADSPEKWARYLERLRTTGRFDGGSSMGHGERFRKNQASQPAEENIDGFIRVRAASIEDAKQFLEGNPVYEAGGTVEIRELPRT